MSHEAAKTHTVQLGNGPTEQVTDHQLAQIKKMSGRSYDQYTVTPIAAQPAKPAAELPTTPKAPKEPKAD